MHLDNIGQIEVCDFLKHLLRYLRGNVIAILDNSNTHKGARIAEFQKRNPRITIEYFPSYAPQLNPDEGVWSYSNVSFAHNPSGANPEPRSGSLPPTPPPGAWLLDP
jgi:putative transposase